MVYEIRERDIGGVLDTGIVLFRDHWKFVSLVALVFIFPLNLATSLVSEIIAPSTEIGPAEPTPGTVIELFNPNQIAWMGVLGVLFIVMFFTVSYAQGVLYFGMANRYLGRTVTVRECLRVGLQRLPYLLVTNLVVGLAVFVGSILCLIPGIIAKVLFFLVGPVVVLENAEFGSMARSSRLVSGYAWQTFVLIMVVGIIEFGVGLLSALVPVWLSMHILSSLIMALFRVYTYLVILVMYFSARCRVENLDLDLMVNAVDTSVPAESRL